jgi:hypothetical protein
MIAYVPATVLRLLRHVLRQQDGRGEEVGVGSILSERDDFRFRAWQTGFLVLVVAMALGPIRPGADATDQLGASWG